MASAALLAAATPAAALPGPDGRLTQVNSGASVSHGCTTDDGSGGACTDGRALAGTSEIELALAPGGTQVYAGGDSGIAVLQRDFRSGAALPSFGFDGCFTFSGSADGFPCGAISGAANPMGAVSGIAASPDGSNVYATVPETDSLIAFHRNPATGLLTALGDMIGGGIGVACTALTPGTPASTTGCANGRSLDGPGEVAVSPDGAFVYVTSQDSDAVSIFIRGAGGALTQVAGSAACLSGDGSSEDGAGTCADGNDTVLSDDDEMPIAVSPDSAIVFVGGSGGVVSLVRQGGGGLAEAQCVYGAGAPAPGCSPTTPGLDEPTDLAISPDGHQLYATSAVRNALGWVQRDVNGLLTGNGTCVGEVGPCTASGIEAMTGPEAVALSADGTSVYVATGRGPGQSRAVATFSRDAGSGWATQLPGNAGCISETPGAPADTAGCTNGKALDGSVSVVATPDGNHVYSGGLGPTDGVAAFQRTSPPDTALTVAPPRRSKHRRAAFTLASSEPASAFICRLDKQAERFCNAVTRTPKLKKGRHHFEGYAIDGAGQADPTPVAWDFVIKKKGKRHKKGGAKKRGGKRK